MFPMAETVYTVMLRTTSYVVSAGAVQALQRASARGRATIRVVPIGTCAHCLTPHASIEIPLADVRAIVRHDASGSLALASSEKVVPLRRFAAAR
ncbi:MAG: hypothetical protein NVS3B7_14010 [Candidatus Elarobacter sp.]